MEILQKVVVTKYVSVIDKQFFPIKLANSITEHYNRKVTDRTEDIEELWLNFDLVVDAINFEGKLNWANNELNEIVYKWKGVVRLNEDKHYPWASIPRVIHLREVDEGYKNDLDKTLHYEGHN